MKITGVTPFLVEGEEKYGAATGSVEATDQGDRLLVVRVDTDEGLTGWADVETLGPVAARVLSGRGMGALGFRTIAEEVVGRDPLRPDLLWDDLYVATAYYGRRGVAMQCMSAVDNCLWSIRAQAENTDLATLLGGRRRASLPAYASTLFRPSPDENAAATKRYVDLGYRAVKFGWGGFGIDPGLDKENLAAIRSALPAGHELMVDPGWFVEDRGRPRTRSLEQTRTMLTGLVDVRPYWVEDFVHPEDFATYARLRAEFPSLRFAAGEQQATIWDFRRLSGEAHIDVLQPDLSRCGGLTVAQAIRDEIGGEIVTHSWLTDLLHAYSLHFLATLENATWVEFNVAQSMLSSGVCHGRLALAPDGTVAVPTAPGLGVEVDEDFVRARLVAD